LHLNRYAQREFLFVHEFIAAVSSWSLASTVVLERAMKDPIVTPKSAISVQDRLDCGNLTIDEVCALKSRSRTGFYADVKAGLVSIEKIGRKSVVRGPVVKTYISR
jgi:hypothetical protein